MWIMSLNKLQCCQLWSELAGLGPNSDLFGKIGPKKVWIGDQKSDFSPKLTYLTTHPEFDYRTFILGMHAWQAQESQVVKLFAKRVWFYPIFGPILVWFSLKMRSDLGPNLEIYGLISQLGNELSWPVISLGEEWNYVATSNPLGITELPDFGRDQSEDKHCCSRLQTVNSIICCISFRSFYLTYE